MGLTADDYVAQQQALLPRGAAWPRDASAMLTKLLAAKAEEFARIDARVEDLAIEANPATSYELLPDWERVCGLPDPCVGAVEPTLQGRHNALVSKLAGAGSASIPYFKGVAALLGYPDVTITEFRAFTVGHSCSGDALTGGDWLYTWRITLPQTTFTYFRVGASRVGEPLAIWGDALFACRFGHLKPAHTILQIAYEPAHLVLDDGGALLLGTGGYILI